VQNVPECLKLPSVHRERLRRDFNHSLEQVIALKGPAIVIMLSSPVEITKSFMKKMFGSLIENKTVSCIYFNRITSKAIDDVLRQICSSEEIQFQSH